MVLTRMENKKAVKQPPCIWMQAGVVPKKLCRLQYQCSACAYDSAMRRVASENKQLVKDGKVPKGKRMALSSDCAEIFSRPPECWRALE